MNIRFSTEQIKKVCGNLTFLQGEKYWKNQLVQHVEIDELPMGVFITSSVKGDQGRVYNQSIFVFGVVGLKGDAVTIKGECSCPKFLNCKHVAAALLSILEAEDELTLSSDNDPGSIVNDWLEKLKSASTRNRKTTIEQITDSSDMSLLYILKPGKKSERSLQVETVKSRQLKSGGYGKPSAYALEKIQDYHNDVFIQQADKDIARLLSEKQNYYQRYNVYQLEGEIGEWALQKMITSGHCHWQKHSSPELFPGPSRKLRFSWQERADGHHLVSQVEPPVNFIFQLHNLWYVDKDTWQIGLVEHDQTKPEQVLLLMDAPIIPVNKVDEVSRDLLLQIPEYQLPLPSQVDIKHQKISGKDPVLHLRLRSMEGLEDVSAGKRFHAAQLSFGYGPVIIDNYCFQNFYQRQVDDTFYSIDRETESEVEAIDLLHRKGLVLLHARTLSEDDQLDWFFPTHPINQSAMNWHDFMENDLSELQELGWKVEIDDTFYLRFESADQWQAEIAEEGTNDWFSLSLGVELDGERINLLPTLVGLLSESKAPKKLREALQQQNSVLVCVGEHRWLKLPTQRLLPIFDTLVELYDHDPLTDDGKIALSRMQSIQMGELLNDPNLHWRGAAELQKLTQQLQDFSGVEKVDPPADFNAELRTYQQQGLNWLQFLRQFEFNGILADDMGLGKTVQTLAHLLLEKQSGRQQLPSIVVAPTSLIGNWRREAERFAPDLKVLVLHGSERHANFELIRDYDLVVTTYPLLRRDKEKLVEQRFYYVILDESQFIKNPKSQTTQVVFQLKSAHRLCLTGTPMENHLGELWSMFHFLMPGFLGQLERFNRIFRNPIEKYNDGDRKQEFKRRIAPFLLRRTKEKVAAELPAKTEIIRSVVLEGKQRDLYESIRLAMDQKVREEISKIGLARSHIMILDALLKLRQVCCDPRLLSLPQAEKVKQSAKLELLMEILPEMVEEGRKILLFSQFTSMLALIEKELIKKKIVYTKLTGQTKKRDEAVTMFQQGEVPVFLISLKAGGVGLNLTAADTVIHYDPWWNPAVENQATDRAHRIGQDKAIFVYKLIIEETVEEKILTLQQKKQALANSVYSNQQKQEDNYNLGSDDLLNLLKPFSE